MAADEFDPYERIAGFSLVSIKAALTFVGFDDDCEDVERVARSLGCPQNQAARVLEELERRGFVTATTDPNYWDMTNLGKKLAYFWHPPRKFRPAIEREDEAEVCGEVFETVPCSILRSTPDNEDMFEEAQLDVAVTVSCEDDRLVEFNVGQPDDYDDPGSGGVVALSAYVTIADAKRLGEGLKKAIAKAERELERRAKKKAKQAKREAAKAKGGGKSKLATKKGRPPPKDAIDKLPSSSPSSGVPGGNGQHTSGNSAGRALAPPATTAEQTDEPIMDVQAQARSGRGDAKGAPRRESISSQRAAAEVIRGDSDGRIIVKVGGPVARHLRPGLGCGCAMGESLPEIDLGAETAFLPSRSVPGAASRPDPAAATNATPSAVFVLAWPSVLQREVSLRDAELRPSSHYLEMLERRRQEAHEHFPRRSTTSAGVPHALVRRIEPHRDSGGLVSIDTRHASSS